MRVPSSVLINGRCGYLFNKSLCAAGVLQVHVRVSIPKGISGEERELVQQLKELQSKTRVGPFTF